MLKLEEGQIVFLLSYIQDPLEGDQGQVWGRIGRRCGRMGMGRGCDR